MKNTQSKVFSYATLFDPVVARAVAARAAQWDLPRHECHPLDRYPGRRVAADLAAYDEQVELAPVPEEDNREELRCDEPGHEAAEDPDYDDDEDFDDDDDF
jgi:hypothetical protein